MPAFRSVMSGLSRSWETFLYTLKAGHAGGRLRRPSSAGIKCTPRVLSRTRRSSLLLPLPGQRLGRRLDDRSI
jgi:hypothetical protein